MDREKIEQAISRVADMILHPAHNKLSEADISSFISLLSHIAILKGRVKVLEANLLLPKPETMGDDALTVAYMAGFEKGKDKSAEELAKMREALKKCIEVLTNPDIGTIDYMEGSQIYKDFRDVADIAQQALGK